MGARAGVGAGAMDAPAEKYGFKITTIINGVWIQTSCCRILRTGF